MNRLLRVQQGLAGETFSDMCDFIEREKFGLEVMQSGRTCLNLTSCLDWEEFTEFAEKIAKVLGADIVKKTDSCDIRIWDLSLSGVHLWLVFEDFPTMVSLESTSETGDAMLVDLDSKVRSDF